MILTNIKIGFVILTSMWIVNVLEVENYIQPPLRDLLSDTVIRILVF